MKREYDAYKALTMDEKKIERAKVVLRENRESLDKYWSDYWKTKTPDCKVNSGLKEMRVKQ